LAHLIGKTDSAIAARDDCSSGGYVFVYFEKVSSISIR